MKQLKALILAAATLVMAQAYAESDAQIEKIRERIAPVGEVCVGAECGGVAVVAGEPRTGEEVYNTACTACHGAGVLGAPRKAIPLHGMIVWRRGWMKHSRMPSRVLTLCLQKVTARPVLMMKS